MPDATQLMRSAARQKAEYWPEACGRSLLATDGIAPGARAAILLMVAPPLADDFLRGLLIGLTGWRSSLLSWELGLQGCALAGRSEYFGSTGCEALARLDPGTDADTVCKLGLMFNERNDCWLAAMDARLDERLPFTLLLWWAAAV